MTTAYFTCLSATDFIELSDEFYIAQFFTGNTSDARRCHQHKVNTQKEYLSKENQKPVYTHEVELPDANLAPHDVAEKLWYELFPDFLEDEHEYSTNSFDAGAEFDEDVIDEFMDALIARGYNGAHTIDGVTETPVIAYFDMHKVIVKDYVVCTKM